MTTIVANLTKYTAPAEADNDLLASPAHPCSVAMHLRLPATWLSPTATNSDQYKLLFTVLQSISARFSGCYMYFGAHNIYFLLRQQAAAHTRNVGNT